MFLDFFKLFIPNICPLCNASMLKSETVICFVCKKELPKTNFLMCPSDNSLIQNFWGRAEVKYAVAFYFYNKGLRVQKLIHILKYKNRPDVGVEIGKTYGILLSESGIFNDVSSIIPVPLHEKKKKIRGYNQAEMFAAGLSESMNIPVDTLTLQKKTFTETQTKKNRFARWKNVEEKFHLVHPENITGKHVILTDDVITTGATLESCMINLKKAADVTVSLVSIACAVN